MCPLYAGVWLFTATIGHSRQHRIHAPFSQRAAPCCCTCSLKREDRRCTPQGQQICRCPSWSLALVRAACGHWWPCSRLLDTRCACCRCLLSWQGLALCCHQRRRRQPPATGPSGRWSSQGNPTQGCGPTPSSAKSASEPCSELTHCNQGEGLTRAKGGAVGSNF